MGKFIVRVLRTSHASKEIEVEAENKEQAIEKAKSDSVNHDFVEDYDDYDCEFVKEKEEED